MPIWSKSVKSSNVLSAGSILIVGAGISGLAAARELQRNGFKVKVLEARNRVGGRIWTDRSLGAPLDLGAGWIHGKSKNPIFDLCRKFKIKTAITDYADSCLLDEGGREVQAFEKLAFAMRANRIMPRLKRLRKELSQDISVAEAIELLAERANIGQKELRFLNRQLIEIEAYNGATLSELSLFHIVEAAEHRHGEDLMFPEGYSKLTDCLREGIEVKLNEEVQSVQDDGTGVKIVSNKGTYKADAAVITLPLGVLKKQAVQFVPALPQAKLEAISTLKLGLFNKVAMRFSEVFWSKEADFIELIPQEKRGTIQFLSLYRYSMQPILVTCLAAETAREWEIYSDEETKLHTLELLRTLYGERVTEPVATTITRWDEDKYAGGAYSILSLGSTRNHFEELGKAHGRMFFAGEACIFEKQGTVHGAYETGLRAAREIKEWAKASKLGQLK